MHDLTPSQQAVLDAIGKTTTVSAGAGAGKTLVMVERIAELLRRSREGTLPEEMRVDASGILVITFTDAASSEIKFRLVERLDQLGMFEERRQVETAYISTIHGFCNRILKENPFEAGLDPQFRVLGAGENTILLERSFQQIVDDGFTHARPEVIGLFQGFSTARRFQDQGIDPIGMIRQEAVRVYDVLRSLGWRMDGLGDWIQLGEDGMCAAAGKIIRDHMLLMLSRVSALIHGMQNLSLRVSCPMEAARCRLLDLLPGLDATVRAASVPLPSGSPQVLPEEMDGLMAFIRLFTEVRTLAGQARIPREADPAAGQALKDQFRSLGELIDTDKKARETFEPGFERESARQAYWLLILAHRLWETHSILKYEQGVLDYNDLQSFARDLLESSPPVLERYRRRLRHIMVDEFQDTDGLQKQILDLLRSDRSLCCVGDPKQSIYGFRNADVTIFGTLIQSTRNASPDTHCHLPLNESFRCHPQIIAVVNHIFSAIGVGRGIEYDPLVSGGDFGPRDCPSVELLLAVKNPNEDGPLPEPSPTSSRGEAELIAKRIRQIVEKEEIRITNGPRSGEPVRFEDFLILLRSFTQLHEYEAALHRHGVDHYVVGGRGYYALREIRDIANILQVIRNPLDDVALAATLRSPFCGLTDEGLAALAPSGRRGSHSSLYERVLHAISAEDKAGEAGISPAFPEADLERLRSFWPLIESMRQSEDRTPITSILEKLLAETLYEARILLSSGGRRKMANIRKLVASASLRNTCGVSDFLEWLRQQSRVEEKEGEAPMEEEHADVVRIRTIHKAKGLERNVVIVAGLSRPVISPLHRPAFLFDVERRAGGCQYPSPESFNNQASATYTLLSRAADERECDEALRILYVAMTRARELLILAGTYPVHPRSWAARVLPRLEVAAMSDADEVREIAPGVRYTLRTKAASHRRQSSIARELVMHVQQKMRLGLPLDPSLLNNLSQRGT